MKDSYFFSQLFFFFHYFLNQISFSSFFFFSYFELILRNWQLTNIQLDSWLMVSCVPKEMFSFPWPWVWVPLISIIVIYISHKSKQNLSHFIFFLFYFSFGPRKMNAYHAILWLMHVCCSKKKKKWWWNPYPDDTHWFLDLYHHVCNGVRCNACFWGSIRYSCIMHASILYTIRDQQNQSDRKYIWSFGFEDRLQKDWNGRLFIEKWRNFFDMFVYIFILGNRGFHYYFVYSHSGSCEPSKQEARNPPNSLWQSESCTAFCLNSRTFLVVTSWPLKLHETPRHVTKWAT